MGSFLRKGEDIKDKDLVEIANEGKEVEGNFGTQNLFLVKTKEKEGNVAFNQTTINNLIDAYGEDSKNWIGKKALVWAILSNVQGKMTKVYYFTHPEAVLNDDGQFVLADPTMPGIKPGDKKEVTIDEIPF